MKKIKPFIKWVGGKQAIVDDLMTFLPEKFVNYYEPFVGGGSLFYCIRTQAVNCYLSDINKDLITAYCMVRDRLEELVQEVKVHQEHHCSDYYYAIREQGSLSDPLQVAARFIYLMQTCYNGLYRVNKKGQFNSSLGTKRKDNICNEKKLCQARVALSDVNIVNQDFAKIEPKPGDFVYFDPPHHPGPASYSRNYTDCGFTEKDQIRLRNFAQDLTEHGVHVMISNSDTDFVHELYQKEFHIIKLSVPRKISCKSSSRGLVTETLIMNY